MKKKLEVEKIEINQGHNDKKKLIMSVQFDKLLRWANQNLMESSP